MQCAVIFQPFNPSPTRHLKPQHSNLRPPQPHAYRIPQTHPRLAIVAFITGCGTLGHCTRIVRHILNIGFRVLQAPNSNSCELTNPPSPCGPHIFVPGVALGFLLHALWTGLRLPILFLGAAAANGKRSPKTLMPNPCSQPSVRHPNPDTSAFQIRAPFFGDVLYPDSFFKLAYEWYEYFGGPKILRFIASTHTVFY